MPSYEAIIPLGFEKHLFITFYFTQLYKLPAAFNFVKDWRNLNLFTSKMPIKLHNSSEITPVATNGVVIDKEEGEGMNT